MAQIVVEPKINNGRPSIPCSNGGFSTVRQVVALVEGGLEIKETALELGLTQVDVMTCIEYKKKYPEIMQ